MMKLKSYILLLVAFFAVNGLLNAQSTIAKQAAAEGKCLALVGYFGNPALITGIKVYLYEGSTKIDSISTTSLKTFGFILARDKHYTLQIIKKGFYPRLIQVNSELSQEIDTCPLFIFEFETTLLPVIKGVDDFYADFPIAVISYDRKIKKFTYHKSYTDEMKDHIKKIENTFKMRHSG